MPALILRVELNEKGRIGPGKIELLEHVAESGSISAAARSMDMSYKRAWDLIDEMNQIFGKPVVAAQTGGRKGGGAQLTPLGVSTIKRFRAIEHAALDAARVHIDALQAEVTAQP